MTSRDCLDRPAPSLALPGLLVLLAALLAGLLACAGDPPASCGAIGRVSSCPCPGGAQGAQECGPAGVWSACACPGADAGAEVGADAVAVVDAGPEASADDAPPALDADAVAVVDAPDGRDASTDAGVDASPDTSRDTSSDLPDAPSDRAPDRPDSAPDPLLEQVSAVRVTVTGAEREWSTARTQMCTVTGGTVSVGADYDTPTAVGCTFLGPSTLTYISGGRGYSDVRAELRTGAPYLTDGESVRRVNVQARGQIPGGLALTLTALGCVVR